MFSLLFSNVASFFSKQWGIITSLGFGLYILFRSIRYIEQSALSRQEVKRLRDDISRYKKGRELRNEYIERIDAYDDGDLDRSMRDWGEFRDEQHTNSSELDTM